MHIAHLILTRRFAGSERYAIELANAQVDAGHRVTVVLRRAATENRLDAIAHRLDSRISVVTTSNFLVAWQARRVLRRLKPDVAHAHLSAGCRALQGLDGRCLRVATLHIHYKPQQHQHLDGLIAIAPWQLADIPESLRRHSVQIDNWTRSIPASAGARERLRNQVGIANDAFVFGALGRIESGKGLDVLVEAWQRAALPADARLVIVGQGGAYDAVRQLAPASVVMPGFVANPRDWMEVFDVFVSAARREPFGLVFLEAMSAGLPILASASDGARHLSAHIGTPLLPVGDVKALAAVLIELHATRPSRQMYSMQPFEQAARVAEIEAFYRRELRHLRASTH